MSWYKEHKQEWKEIIETISREVNRTPQRVEKHLIKQNNSYQIMKKVFPKVNSDGIEGVALHPIRVSVT